MKMKTLLMALAVVVCTTTSADLLPPAAKAQAIKAAAALNNLLAATGATTLCIDPDAACHWAATSAYTVCLGNVQSAYANCQAQCAKGKLRHMEDCQIACTNQQNTDKAACDKTYEEAVEACRNE